MKQVQADLNQSSPISPTLLSEISFPSVCTPSIDAHRIYDDSAPIAAFGDDTWPLHALNSDLTRNRYYLSFKNLPEGFRDFVKNVMYVAINYETPPALMDTARVGHVLWLSAGSLHKIHAEIRAIVHWLAGPWSEAHPGTPVSRPLDMDSHHQDDVRRWVEGRAVGATARNSMLATVVRLWHYNPWLPPAENWPEPLWRERNYGSKRNAGENNTKRLAQSTMGPLLEWAIAFVTLFAEDILAADQHYRERSKEIAPFVGAAVACREVLQDYMANGLPLPGSQVVGTGKRSGYVAWTALAYKHRLPSGQFSKIYSRLNAIPVDADPLLSALDFEVSAKFYGRPWTPYLGVYDFHRGIGRGKDCPGQLVAHLRTACIIVSGYLTGARPEEILGWEHGAAPDPIQTAGGSRLHLIHGRVWKGVPRKVDGSPGDPKIAAWATIAPATTAIHVAERINKSLGRSDGLIFTDSGRKIPPSIVAKWIAEFTEYVNTRLVPNTVNPSAFTVPPDPDGRVALTRFRRTVAWFIRNFPDGDITAAIQYQHLDSLMAGGYSGTKSSGMKDVMAEEDWTHRRETIYNVADLLAAGQGISGPAASRAVAAVQGLPRDLTPGDERRLKRDKTLVMYDNPSAVALCLYSEKTALCHRVSRVGGPGGPDLLNCVDGCPNCGRTDAHLMTLDSQAAALRNNAAVAPRPMAQSLNAEADRREKLSEQFRKTRITLTALSPTSDSDRDSKPR